MCSCPLHDNRNGLDVCTCLCQEHDTLFDQGVVLVRQAVRRYQRVAQDEIKGIHNRLNAVNQLYDEQQAGISRLLTENERLRKDVVRVENSLPGIYARMGGVEDELMRINERLSPPETMASADKPPVEDIAAFAEGRDLPPDMWDRYGTRWTCKGRYGSNDLLWESVQTMPLGHKRIVTIRGTDLEASGPFTSKSPLAEDQEPLPDTGEAKDVRVSPHVGRETATAWSAAFDSMVLPENQPVTFDDDEPGLWSEPWEPQFIEGDTDVLAIAIRQAVGAASTALDNLEGAGVFDDQKALWVASGLQRWIESRYQLFDRPAHQSDEFDHLPKSERGRARQRAASGDQALINRALKAEAEARDLRRVLGELRTDFIRIQAIAGQHAAYEGAAYEGAETPEGGDNDHD